MKRKHCFEVIFREIRGVFNKFQDCSFQ